MAKCVGIAHRPSPLCVPMLRTRCGYCPKNCIGNMQVVVEVAKWVLHRLVLCVFYALNPAFVTLSSFPTPFLLNVA